MGGDFAVAVTEEDFAKNLEYLPALPRLWAGRQEPLSMDDTRMRLRKWGHLFSVEHVGWLARVVSVIRRATLVQSG